MDIQAARKRRANELKNFRLETGLTQLKLSELSGLTQSTISKIERGIVAWSIDNELIYFETLKNHTS